MMFLGLFVSVVFIGISESDDSVCCTPDQWEAVLFWDNGNVFLDKLKSTAHQPSITTAYSYINGTAKTAYDFTNGRSYIQVSATEISPLIPQPVRENTTLIRDYKNGVQYQIDGTQCQKSPIDPLKRHCIPDSALGLGTGFLVNSSLLVATFAYIFTVDAPYQVQSTVIKSEQMCLPVHVTFLIPSVEEGSGAMNNLEFFDTSPGIKDSSIFNIPPQCRNAQMTAKKTAPWISLFL